MDSSFVFVLVNSIQLERGEGTIDYNVHSTRLSRMIIATFIACLGRLCFGYAIGYSSSALLDLEAESNAAVRFTKTQGSWFAALLNAGAILGGPLGGWLVESVGRKGGIMLCCVPFEIGWLLISYAKNHFMLYSGRFIVGIAVGMISLVVPVYIAEISSPKLRGTLCSASQLAMTIGLALSFSLGVVVKWRWLALIAAVPPALLAMLMFFMPETPVWSLSHHRRDEAIQALKWLKGPGIDAKEECNAIESNIGNRARITFTEFCKPTVLRPLLITVMVMFFQQFSGVNAVLYNCAAVFKDAGFENAKAVAMIVAGVQFCGTGIACLIMDKAGRKVLLWSAAVGMAVSLIALAVYFEIYIPKDGSPTEGIIHSIHHSILASRIAWLAIISLITFFLSFALAWGPIPWILMSELFPLKARGIAGGISIFVNWSAGFVVTKTFVDFQSALTPPGTFLFYGSISFTAFLFVLFVLPETKGKSLEEIEMIFVKDQQIPEYEPLL